MFEGEERWSRNCGSGIGLTNYKNVYKDNTLVGNWCEQLYGESILRDASNDPPAPDHYASVTMSDYSRKPLDPDRQRGGCNIESMPYELLFGHGEELYGETKRLRAEASMSDLQFTKPTWDKPKAHEVTWVGEKTHDLNIPSVTCLLYTSPSPRDRTRSRMPSSA
eukprot:TRINITY_DN4405_c0_g1_i1.p1 TRINITY_DN4405_c0_g1~~TRINITY_DN4405_c0_g1_i1.p1  ORF type:complete len:165 (+),score=40.33 TRINITY_DN4405_c0_g1_i1:178-672(+)